MLSTHDTSNSAAYRGSRRNAMADIFENMEVNVVSRLRQGASVSREIVPTSQQPYCSSCQTPCDGTCHRSVGSGPCQTSTSESVDDEDGSRPNPNTDDMTGQVHFAGGSSRLNSFNTGCGAGSREVKMEFKTSSERTKRTDDSFHESNARSQGSKTLTRQSLSFTRCYHSTDAAFPVATRTATVKMVLTRSRSDYSEYMHSNLWCAAREWNKTPLLL